MIRQSDDSVEPKQSEAQEKDIGRCEFDKYLKRTHLRPIYFISRLMVSPLEKSRNSFVGESDAVKWDIGKFSKYFWVADFTVL